MSTADPTQTTTQRSNWAAEYNSRWRTVRGRVRHELTGRTSLLGDGISPAQRETEFRTFLDRLFDSEVLEPTTPSEYRRGAHWTGGRIRDAYEKGLDLAADRLRDEGYPNVRDATNRRRQAHQDRLEQRYTRAYADTEDVTNAVLRQATTAFTDSVDGGESKSATIAAVNDRVDAVGQTRTKVLANTLTISTANAAALEAYDIAGAQAATMDAEGADTVTTNAAGEAQFMTAGDSRVCPECATYDGVTFAIEDLKSGSAPNPPLHPNCRCFLNPASMETGGEEIEGGPFMF